MTANELEKLAAFLRQTDENGVSNAEKAGGSADDPAHCPGVVTDDSGRLIGFGIHILNESVYPLEKFELFLRDKGLTGCLDLADCRDLVFLDVYRNRLTAANVHGQTAMRILGLQDNALTALDVSTLSACQGIDVGKNRLSTLDVSKNGELVELYIHYNDFTTVDLSHNPKLKYFWCNGNRIARLDATANPLLRHLDCLDNPLVSVRACAPQRAERLPLSLTADEGGYVGLKFCPVYTPQWKETGERQQRYVATPRAGYAFSGWFDAGGALLFPGPTWIDEYGASRELTARFTKA